MGPLARALRLAFDLEPAFELAVDDAFAVFLGKYFA